MLFHKVNKLQNEKDKYKGLYEKCENEVANLNDEISEMQLRHSAEVKTIQSNLDVSYKQSYLYSTV